MNTMNTIIIKVKAIFVKRYGYKISNTELAIILNITPSLFNTYIQKHKIPYEQICNLCYTYKININNLFYNQNSHNTFKIKYFYKTTVSLDTGLIY